MSFVARQLPRLAPDPGWQDVKLLAEFGRTCDLDVPPIPMLGEGAKCA